MWWLSAGNRARAVVQHALRRVASLRLMSNMEEAQRGSRFQNKGIQIKSMFRKDIERERPEKRLNLSRLKVQV